MVKLANKIGLVVFIGPVWIQAKSTFESFSTENIEYISSREGLKRAYYLYPKWLFIDFLAR